MFIKSYPLEVTMEQALNLDKKYSIKVSESYEITKTDFLKMNRKKKMDLEKPSLVINSNKLIGCFLSIKYSKNDFEEYFTGTYDLENFNDRELTEIPLHKLRDASELPKRKILLLGTSNSKYTSSETFSGLEHDLASAGIYLYYDLNNFRDTDNYFHFRNGLELVIDKDNVPFNYYKK